MKKECYWIMQGIYFKLFLIIAFAFIACNPECTDTDNTDNNDQVIAPIVMSEPVNMDSDDPGPYGYTLPIQTRA